MKKSLIALAAMAAVGGAAAQSSVTLYGNIDAGYGSHTTKSRDGSVQTKTRGVMDGAWAGSRIGFRGTEDLGGGLKANFTMEQGVSVTSPDGFNARVASAGHQIPGTLTTYSTGNNRQTWLGLSGGFGEMRIGYQYTNSYDLVAFQGYNWSEYIGHNYQNLAHANGTRANSITYISPNMSGFTLKAQYGSGAGREKMESTVANTTGYAQNNNQYMSLMGLYAAGPLSVGYVYSRSNIEQAGPVGATTSTFNVAGAAPALPTNTAERDVVAHHIAGSWDFGVAKVAATHGRVTSDGSTVSTADTETTATQLTVQAPVGAFTLMGAYGRAETEVTGVAAPTLDSKGWALGVSYALSKRTNVYAFSGRETNKAVATAATAGYRDTKSIVGVRHAF